MSLPTTDAAWDAQYPQRWRAAAEFHFVPLLTARAASDWLVAGAAPGATFVDLGSGAGKFGIVAAQRHPQYHWVGLELRAELVAEANAWRGRYQLDNLSFAKADITTATLSSYAGAFLYNPFYEQTEEHSDLGDGLPTGPAAYALACSGLRQNLALVASGFRLAAYFCYGQEIPSTFARIWTAEADKLEGWLSAL